MKARNIKKQYRKRINDGWRYYLTLRPSYEMLGLDRSKFMTKEELGKAFGLIPDYDHEELSVDEYAFYSGKEHDGVKETVSVSFSWCFDKPELSDSEMREWAHLEDKQYILRRDGKVYYAEFLSGYHNPKYTGDIESEEPYWLFDEDEDGEFAPISSTYFTDSFDSKEEEEMVHDAYEAYANKCELSENIFSGNEIFSLLFNGGDGAVGTDFMKDLSELSDLCKTTYEEIKDDHVDICFAIRYKNWVEPFLKKLKKIVLKYKVKL